MIRSNILAALCGLLVTGPAPAIQTSPDGRTITLSPEEAAECASGGGCVVAPRAALNEALGIVAARAKAEMRASCRNAT